MDKQALLDLIPAYAIDALDSDERALVEAQLQTDPEARRLLDEYRTVGDALALAVPAVPAPAHLGDDLRRRMAASRARPALPMPAASRRRMVYWRVGAALSFAAMFLLILALVNTLTAPIVTPERTFSTLAAQTDAIRIALAPGEGQDTVSGEMVASADGSQVMIAVSGLPALPAEQIFQLWLREADGDVYSGGLFQAEDETTFITVPVKGAPLEAFIAFGVSIEPAGGSPYADRPTGPRVFAVPLPQES